LRLFEKSRKETFLKKTVQVLLFTYTLQNIFPFLMPAAARRYLYNSTFP